MFSPAGLGYDRAITIFSPEGRLYQVEYAMEAVKAGTTCIGIRCKDAVVLAAERRVTSKLADPSFYKKIFQIDEHIGVAVAGLSSDARVLISKLRVWAQSNRLTYGEAIEVEALAQYLGDLMQLYTQHAGVRPFGVAILIAGVSDGSPKLFMVDPSGNVTGYYATAMGAGAQSAISFLEKKYSMDMNMEEAILLALRCLGNVIETDLSPENVDLAVISIKDGKFRRFTEEEIRKYIEQLKKSEMLEKGGKE